MDLQGFWTKKKQEKCAPYYNVPVAVAFALSYQINEYINEAQITSAAMLDDTYRMT